jgi:26 proteasome complex subunit DSS1
MADAASSSKVEVPTKVIDPHPHKDDDHPAALGVLEEDDEFEEFPVAGKLKNLWVVSAY